MLKKNGSHTIHYFEFFGVTFVARKHLSYNQIIFYNWIVSDELVAIHLVLATVQENGTHG